MMIRSLACHIPLWYAGYGDGLERRGGGKLKSILESMTSSPFKGVLLGAGVTTERKYTNRALAKDIPEQII